VKSLQVRDVMTHLVATFRSHDTIYDAAQRLGANRISGAPVVDGGRLVGVVSEVDLLRSLAPGREREAAFGPSAAITVPLLLPGTATPRDAGRVGDVMSTEVVSIPPEASVLEAASLIDRCGFRRLPVVDGEGFVVGILTRSDLVRAMVRIEQDAVSLGSTTGTEDKPARRLPAA
jgi:CBS domain-containing protein